MTTDRATSLRTMAARLRDGQPLNDEDRLSAALTMENAADELEQSVHDPAAATPERAPTGAADRNEDTRMCNVCEGTGRVPVFDYAG